MAKPDQVKGAAVLRLDRAEVREPLDVLNAVGDLVGIAAISDAVSPVARAPVVGVYCFWRDIGYALGAVIAGATADALSYGGAIGVVAALTAASGVWVLFDMPGERSPAAGSWTSPGQETPAVAADGR